MNVIRRIISASHANHGSRFNRYYGYIIRPGSGYPTADEARRDLTAYSRSSIPYGWPY